MSKSWKIAGETNAKVGKVAGVTGLEPAASGVTGQRSNQLSYTPTLGSEHCVARKALI